MILTSFKASFPPELHCFKEDDIDKDISLTKSFIDRDISLANNFIDRDISLEFFLEEGGGALVS